ncbi:putative small lipoprotein YifL [Friedmanniella endophytica]|uniref:Putative small lipoprotein YifL n=1 Tax=Microlunatus kandeliicorticis TaxID=1759536 RepID=A0A7W3IVR4_9ACTN|nr:RsiV family protein [Microlunatus kandeliicorticis]MBA8796070.1 putative small lipoprotein YifL [Microlunatus kandeliicorticis]
MSVLSSRRRVSALAWLVAVVTVAGCGLTGPTAGGGADPTTSAAAPPSSGPNSTSSASSSGTPSESSSAASSSATSPSASASSSETPGIGATVLPAPPKANTGVLAVKAAVLTGRERNLRWTIRVPQFSGTPRAQTVNQRIRASAGDAITAARRTARESPNDRVTLDGRYTLSTNDGRTAQAALTFDTYTAGAAHGNGFVGTTAIDVTTGKPILLTDVFRSESAALRVIAPKIKAIAESEGEPVSDPSGLRPVHANFANWQSTGAGITFYFQDYQLGGHGLRMYTVGWNDLSGLITDYARRTLAPPRR